MTLTDHIVAIGTALQGCRDATLRARCPHCCHERDVRQRDIAHARREVRRATQAALATASLDDIAGASSWTVPQLRRLLEDGAP